MNNDLSNCKVGDLIWTIREGWTKIKRIRNTMFYIETDSYKYTNLGYAPHDKYPSAFREPPEGFNAEPKPCEFKKGDKVLVRSINGKGWQRRHFVRIENGMFHCYIDGKDEWSSEGLTNGWKYCKKWEE
jgi:hypothetical protein